MKQVIVLRKDLGMSSGKAIAQACHASVEAYLQCASSPSAIEWRAGSKTKVALAVNSEDELVKIVTAAAFAGLPKYLVRDEGRTELKGSNYTCVAIGPASAEIIDKVTGHLNLYR